MNIAIGASPICYARGGTERVAIGLANAMSERGHCVHLLGYDHGTEPVFDVSPKVHLNLLPSTFSTGSHSEIARVRQYLIDNEIDVFLSMQSQWTHMLWGLCCLGTSVPFIASERSDPRFSEAVTWNRPGRMSVLACADVIHELLDAHIEAVPEIFRSKVRVIPNAAPQTDVRAEVEKTDGVILFLARFIPGKRADLLIRAFALLAPRFPAWRLRLAGYGPEEQNLRQLVLALQLQERVDFVISPRDWQQECANAQIYCLPTRVEGFPNSVLEAMACGLPVVGLGDCPSMASIVEDGVNGLLAKDASPESLARVLAQLMENPSLRLQVSQNAVAQCASRYDAENILDQWEELFRQTATKKGSTIMDSFTREDLAHPFTLSAAARREYLYRNFGDPMPWSWPWWRRRMSNLVVNARNSAVKSMKLNLATVGRNLASLGESIRLAKSPRELPYLFRQIKKTRLAAPGRSGKRSQAFANWLNARVPLKGKKVLCVGCGDVRELDYLRALGCEVTGCDLHGGDGVRAMNMENLEFADDSFDVVYACHSFEHAKNQHLAAREFARTLKHGGHIAVEVPANAEPDTVDLHQCLFKGCLSSCWSKTQGHVLVEDFFSRHDPANGAEEDIWRLLFQKK